MERTFSSVLDSSCSLLKRKKKPGPHEVEENCCRLSLICIPQSFFLAGQRAAFLSRFTPLERSEIVPEKRKKDYFCGQGEVCSLTRPLTKQNPNNAKQKELTPRRVKHLRGFGISIKYLKADKQKNKKTKKEEGEL